VRFNFLIFSFLAFFPQRFPTDSVRYPRHRLVAPEIEEEIVLPPFSPFLCYLRSFTLDNLSQKIKFFCIVLFAGASYPLILYQTFRDSFPRAMSVLGSASRLSSGGVLPLPEFLD